MNQPRTRSTDSLPTPLSPLIGRGREVADAAALIQQPEVRLITLTGPGGVGKTRLAIAVTQAALHAFSDGALFVDLSSVRDQDLVVPAIAHELGLALRAQYQQAVIMALSERRHMLLVLDNFEQVVDAAPEIARLLRRVDAIKVLITSREALRIDGEREFPISPLDVVPDSFAHDPEQLRQIGSIRLFVDRAQATQPSFALAPANAATVAAICTRLDGLPLAIELAAARVKALPLEAILNRLDHPLPLLVGDRRDAPERQQTMRNAIAWSYSLLTDREQVAFRRLGVFVDGFTLDAAESVLSGGILANDVLPALVSLVDKSLVRLNVATPGGSRYVMLETIREFATERLLASDEQAVIRDAHAAWCIGLAEQRRLHGDIWNEAGGPTASPPVATEFGNIRAALQWLAESDNLTELARLAGSVIWYWQEYGPRSEGLRWHRLARTARPGTQRDKQSLMWALDGLSILARNTGHFDEALSAAEESLALALELDDTLGESTALGLLSFIALGQGDYQRAEDLGLRAMEKRMQLDAGWPVQLMLSTLGESAFGRRDLALARSYLDQALDAYQAAGMAFDVAYTQDTLALIDCEERAFHQAAERLVFALVTWRDNRTREPISEWLATAAVLALAVGHPDMSARMLAAGSSLCNAVGHMFVLPLCEFYEQTERSLYDLLGEEELANVARAVSAQSLDATLDEASAFLNQILAEYEEPPPKSADLRFGLTPREMDVLRLLVSGKSDRDIADALFIGSRTVQTHVSNILAKLDVVNRIEAASFAVRLGIV